MQRVKIDSPPPLRKGNRSPGARVSVNYIAVSVYQCLIFVHLGLRSILVLCKQGKMGEDEVLVNAYEKGILLQSQGHGSRKTQSDIIDSLFTINMN